MNGMFGIDCGDKWLGRWPELALHDLWTQAVGLGYANGWPFRAGEIPTSLLVKVVGSKKDRSLFHVYANRPWTTLPATSVSRKSRPAWR